MDKYQALQGFFSSFGLKAYNEIGMPTGENAPKLPYITYEVQVSDWETRVSTTFSVWYREATWANIYRKSEEIRRKLKSMNTVKYDKGCICITSGSPMITYMGDAADDKIKRAVFNIEMCFIDLR